MPYCKRLASEHCLFASNEGIVSRKWLKRRALQDREMVKVQALARP